MEEKRSVVLETTEFVSKPVRFETKRIHSTKDQSRSRSSSKKRSGSAFLYARLGVCALALCGVLALKLSGRRDALAVISAMTGEEQENYDEDRLGRLKLVELPSIIDVFAPSDKAIIPAEHTGMETYNDGFDLRLSVEPGTEIVSPVDGKISFIGTDEELGSYISIITGGDECFSIYGIKGVLFEQGQPIKQRLKLGEALGGSLTVRVSKAGRPQDVSDVFGLGDGSKI